MSNDFQQNNQFNPYQSSPTGQYGRPPINTAKVQAPAIALIVVGGLGLLASIYSVINALVAAPPVFPPDTPDFVRQFASNSVGPLAAGIQLIFVLVAILILVGGIQMLRFKTWGLALTASILSMVNVGSCCCILGLPIGIWALIILLASDVQQQFAANASR
jgi:hypothetical protein